MRVLGLDYGSARTGIAIGDTETRIASPWAVLDMKDKEKMLQALGALIKEEQIEQLVLGIPRPLADQQRTTAQAQEIQEFQSALERFGLPVIQENETWSSKLAAHYTHDLEQKGKRDDLAAVAILQSYLDRHGVSA